MSIDKDHQRIKKHMLAAKLKLQNIHAKLSALPDDTLMTAKEFSEVYGLKTSRTRVLLNRLGVNPYGDKKLSKANFLQFLNSRILDEQYAAHHEKWSEDRDGSS